MLFLRIFTLGLWSFTLSATVHVPLAYAIDVKGTRLARSVGDTPVQIERVLDRLEALSTYFGAPAAEADQLADGIFGVRTGEEACKAVAMNANLPEHLRERASKLASRFGSIATVSAQHAKTNDPAYYAQFKPFIEKIVSPPFHESALPLHADDTTEAMSTASSASEQADTDGSNLNEEKSDVCFAQVLGTPAKGYTTKPCQVSPSCFQMMTRGHTSSYWLTHQVLFFEMVHQFGCQDKLEAQYKQQLPRGISQGRAVQAVVEDKCGQIYKEMQTELAQGQGHSDIFIEQLYSCGAFGFTNFFHSKWLQATMNAQNPSLGCFQNQGMGSKLVQLGETRDETTADGCSIHKSSVATCLYSVYLHHYLAQLSSEHRNVVSSPFHIQRMAHPGDSAGPVSLDDAGAQDMQPHFGVPVGKSSL